MSYISDEKLMAYVDNELTPSERAEVEAAMEADATIKSRMLVFSNTRDHFPAGWILHRCRDRP